MPTQSPADLPSRLITAAAHLSLVVQATGLADDVRDALYRESIAELSTLTRLVRLAARHARSESRIAAVTR